MKAPGLRLLALLAALIIAPVAHSSPSASFTARKIQGSTCVAPCAVHFDAIGKGLLSSTPFVTEETTDTIYSRPFHSLLYAWDFGDNTASSCGGVDATWENSGAFKKTANGPLAGHTYCGAGTFTVTLTVTNPSGEQSTVQHDVVVADPDIEFSSAETWCFANTANTFTGCPLDTDGLDGDCEGADADHCIVTPNLSTALTSNVDTSGCNADDSKSRCMFATDDTFTASGVLTLFNAAGPGLIESFGSGAPPVLSTGSNTIQPGTGWTLYGFTHNSTAGADAVLVSDNIDSVSLIEFVTNQSATNGCFRSGFSPTANGFPELIALVEYSCHANSPSTTDAATIMWPMANYMVWMGGEIDKSDDPFSSSGHHYSMRSFHSQHWVMQHTHWHSPSSQGNNWQWRAQDSETTPCSDDECANRWNLISDNINENAANNGSERVCVDSGCNCEAGSASPICDGNGGVWRSVSNFIFERNLFTRDPAFGGSSSNLQIMQLSGGDHSFRDNVIDMQGGISSGTFYLVSAYGAFTLAGDTPPASPPEGGVTVTGNTIFWDDSVTANIVLLLGQAVTGASGCPSNCFARNNLVVTPSDASGSLTAFSGTGSATTSNNVRSTSEAIFDNAIPEQGASVISSFVPDPADTVALDQGYDYSAETDFWNHLDARALCRPGGAGWDIGALERDATDCALDYDVDGVPDLEDNCPTLANTNQADGDDDAVGDVCDNCTEDANPRVDAAWFASHDWATLTGGQRDDDHDGFGNICDAKFVGSPTQAVGGLDLSQIRASSGKSKTTDLCGTAGNRPCAIFDLDEDSGDTAIGGLDKGRFDQLSGAVPGPKCAACPLPCDAGANGTCN